MKNFFFFCCLILCYNFSFADHIIGGEINMQCLNPKEPGNYRITVTLFNDDITGTVIFNASSTASVTIRRKSDNRIMRTVVLKLDTRNSVIYTNPACARLRSLKSTMLKFEAIVELIPNEYNDPQGYTIAYQSCCRNTGIDNIVNPSSAAMLFYLEFPPLIKNNRPFVNSTPIFQPLNGEYICINDNFELNYDAVDLDNDVLKYSLVTPYNDANFITGTSPRTNFRNINWAAGFSEQVQIPGNPALTVDEKSGVLRVKANRVGLHVISVLCQEFRAGELIGSIRRDFQFLVVDCGNTVPDPHTISFSGQPTLNEITFCEGVEFELKGNNPNANWNYQWQRNGDNIEGANTPVIIAKEEGEYVVVASFKNVCAKTKVASNKIKVKLTKEKSKLQFQGKAVVCGNASTFQLNAKPFGKSEYSWFFNGDALSSEKNNFIKPSKEGAYHAIVKNTENDCIARTDTVYVNFVNTPPSTVDLSVNKSKDNLCNGDSITLNATNNKDFVYEWFRNKIRFDSTSFSNRTIKISGSYGVSIIDKNGCPANAKDISITFYEKPKLKIDSILAMCSDENSKPIPLNSTPTGGVFSGKGVVGNEFVPTLAGVGKHTIEYTFQGQVECQNGKVATSVEVLKKPISNLKDKVEIFNGMSVLLSPKAENASIFRWSPTQRINDFNLENPTVNPSKTTLYRLTLSNKEGCTSKDSVLVVVINNMIPNIFTPNNDNENDIWDLKFYQSDTSVEVSIFNRWGELVFYSKGYSEPFDGTFRGQKLPVDTYVYTIKPSNELPATRGVLTIVY
jgi:gliding motility-associated-like protein